MYVVAIVIAVIVFIILAAVRRSRVRGGSGRYETVATSPLADETGPLPGVSDSAVPGSSFPESGSRDFLGSRYGFIGEFVNEQMSVREMIEHSGREHVLRVLSEALQVGGTYQRKYAAYSLGQIGDPSGVQWLKAAMRREQQSGVEDAMRVSLTAIQQMPTDKGFTEQQRRVLINDIYYGRTEKS